MTTLLNVLASACLLAGCAASPSKEPAIDTTLTLFPERSIALGPNATLRYDGMADSRCPPGMRCVWAGEVSYRFTLSGAAGAESFALSGGKPAFDASTVKGARIALGTNPEPPLQPAGAPTPAQSVSLTISLP